MAKNMDWREDTEAMGIAMRLVDKYPEIFEGLDLMKVRFVRILTGSGKKIGELKSCDFPYDIDSPYAYYLMIHNNIWKEKSEAQQVLAVMHLLYAIAPSGTDETSNYYAKCRKHDVKDFNVILAAAGGRYDWQETGKSGIVNPLEANENEIMAKIEESE